MNSIEYPINNTYYIVWNEEVVNYGVLTPEQVMTSGLPNIWQTENEQEWIDKLNNDFQIETIEII